MNSMNFQIFDLGVILGKKHENHNQGNSDDFSVNVNIHPIYDFCNFCELVVKKTKNYEIHIWGEFLDSQKNQRKQPNYDFP